VTIFLVSIVGLFLLSIPSLFLRAEKTARLVTYWGSCLCCLVITGYGLVAAAGPSVETVLPIGLPWMGVHLRADALSGFFLVVVGGGGAAACFYGLGYGRHDHEPRRVLPFVPAFLAGMALVTVAADAYTFLFAWELMSLASWALVMAHHKEEGNAWAGFVYLLMATFSGLCLLLAFGLLAGTQGEYVFASMRVGHPTAWSAAIVLALALLGAGSKAGIVPLHVWLPLAHPAAPSHVSALMSGVMTKVAIYALIRIVFDLSGQQGWWWAVPVLMAGGVSAVVGVIFALMERDIKRLLAWSTIENVGIIFLSLGLALAFRANAMPDAAALAMTAALFHTFNHMLFKSTLFFGAGAILNATGLRNIEQLGGLIHRMPYSSAAFLLACMAISALPPLNGFASEWLILQTILISPALPQWTLRLLVPVIGAALALSAALAAACFVRLFAVTYLGRPRSAVAAQAEETDKTSITAMGILAALCLLAGILPGLILDRLAPVTQFVVQASMPTQSGRAWLTLVPITDSRSSYNGLILFLFIVASAGIVAIAVHRLASHRIRRARLWDCGYPALGPITQYTATSLAQPIRRVFGPIFLHAHEEVLIPAPGDMSPARIRRTLRDLAWDLFYVPLAATVNRITTIANHLQFLTIRRYLSLVFAALIVLLVALAIWQ